MNPSAATVSRGERSRPLVLGLLVVFLVLMVATYYRATVLGGYDQEYIAILGQQQLLSQQLAKEAAAAADGQVPAFENLQRVRDAFGQNLKVLEEGDPARGIPPLPPEVSGALADLQAVWRKAEENASAIIQVMKPITSMFDAVARFDKFAAETLLTSDELVNVMVESGSPADQVYVATRQLMLLERINRNIQRALQGGEDAVSGADRFGRDAVYFGQVVQGLLQGDTNLGIQSVTDSEAREVLEGIAAELEKQRGLIDSILENSIELFKVQGAAREVFSSSDRLLGSSRTLLGAYQSAVDRRLVRAGLGNTFAGLALAMLIVLVAQMSRDFRARADEARERAEDQRRQAEEARAREEESRETNRRNQEAIVRLLGEISNLADGDLTVNATVSEAFTGAIADAINYAVEEMRGLVSNINRTAAQVAAAAQETRGTAIRLSEASEGQARQIEQATGTVNNIADELERLSAEASRSTEVAEQSVEIAKKGARAVQNTIEGMDAIRETIQETAKRIKRLGESSQEIGDIVSLIDDIADQTNILALNAAIQASMAGEAGRGFAVVADEVQRLAERAGQATRQIEALVKTIQSDTNDAVMSMEKSTSGVVDGARIAEGAGGALEEIENVSIRLARLIETISEDSRKQSTRAVEISRAMNQISQVTAENTTGTRQTALSIGELAWLADELRRSVAGFKLPQGETAAETPRAAVLSAAAGTA